VIPVKKMPQEQKNRNPEDSCRSYQLCIRHCRRTNCEEKLNNLGVSVANPLLFNFTPGVETNVFQQSNLTQLYGYEYEDN
jgi:hypothetical protein